MTAEGRLAGQAEKELSCFTAGTLVATEDGFRAIESVPRDSRVWAFDLAKSKWRLCRVVKPYSIAYKGTLVLVTIAGETTEATYQHPYWVVRGDALSYRPVPEHMAEVPKNATTPGRWVDSSDLRVGDEVLLRDGRIVPVERIVNRQFEGRVYNMEVEGLCCYTVGRVGVLVHNNNGPGKGKPPLTAEQEAIRNSLLDEHGVNLHPDVATEAARNASTRGSVEGGADVILAERYTAQRYRA